MVDQACAHGKFIRSSLRGLTLDECLEYFKAVLSDPRSAEAWPKWWSRNEDLVRSLFSREHYLKLKFRKLDAARQILVDHGLIDEHELAYHYPSFAETHCRTCGHELFWAIPKQTTRAQIVAYAKLIGSTEIERDGWIHPGVYCPNGCTLVMYNYGSPVNWKQTNKDATNNPEDQSGSSAGSRRF